MILRFQVKEKKLKMPHLFLKYYKHMFELLFLHSNDMSQLGRSMGCENYAVASIIDPIILKTSMPSNDKLSCINSANVQGSINEKKHASINDRNFVKYACIY